MAFYLRLADILKDKQLKVSDFSKITGYHRVNLSNLLRGKIKSPPLEIAVVIAKHFPEINLYWLLTGEGDMYRKASDVMPDDSSVVDQNLQPLLAQMLELTRKQNEQYEKILREKLPELAKQIGLL